MLNFRFDKLVRANMFDIWERDGSVVSTRELSNDEEKYQASLDKIIEEAQEAKVAAISDRADEFADIRAALTEAERHSGVTEATLRSKPSEKNAFAGKLVTDRLVEVVSVTEDNPIVPYLRERYEEIVPAEQA